MEGLSRWVLSRRRRRQSAMAGAESTNLRRAGEAVLGVGSYLVNAGGHRAGRLARGVALLSTGLLAGAFAYAVVSVVPTFKAVPLDVHLQFRTALMHMNGIFMQALMAVSLLSSFWLAITLRGAARGYAAGAGSLALTSLLVTRFGNVPINGRIKTWSASSLPLDHAELLQRWEIYHYLRTATAIAAFLLLIVLIDRAGAVRRVGVSESHRASGPQGPVVTTV
ncbi:DUF1772 domain-containing protein [Actinoplanes regularis]|uniref:Uncharacterized membrane protein n=1 Tax=Actinoplanes regularis TaxID=52697 RepID=A0A239HT32_9ACTN|nr:DUF1772 domain-containing protein [Actinoplanes regularis]SNS84345.1 Uncharacterized membrane protein [Actinoplanes regularis]